MNYLDFGYNNLLCIDTLTSLLVSNINTSNSDALISGGSVGFGQTTLGTLQTNQDMASGNFATGSAGWQIKGDGSAEFKDITLVGGTLRYGKTTFADSTNAGYILSSSGIYLGSASDTKYIKYVIGTGALSLVGVTIDGTATLGGRLGSILASAIDSSGHFIDDALSTASTQILGTFTFGASGALAMITDVDNGLWLSPTGILGKKLGVNTFSIGIDGTANFAGTITGSTITGSTITGGTVQTASSGQRLVLSSNKLMSYSGVADYVLFDVFGSAGRNVLIATNDGNDALWIASDSSGNGIYIETSGTGKAITISDSSTTRTTPLVNISSNIDCALSIQNNAEAGDSAVKIAQLDLDKTAVVISDNSSPTPQNVGMLQVEADTSNALHSLVELRSNTTTDNVHITFVGGVTPSAPSDGDMWYNGSNLCIRIGATTYTLDKTAV